MFHYWFGIVTDGSELEGEEFLVGADSIDEAKQIAANIFSGEELNCYGRVSDFNAEMMGLDEY